MKIRGKKNSGEGVQLNMTAMIDIVFQLLVYFILTFKVTALEGDFSINMPTASDTTNDMIEPLDQTIYVKLVPGEVGMSQIEVDYGIDRQVFSSERMFQELRTYIKGIVLQADDPSNTTQNEVEFDIDRDLQYEFTVMGIESVTGEPVGNGQITTLIEKVRFKDNSIVEND